MKKLFVCALAASMFTACSQDETISQQSPMQISFDGAFVNKASRALEAADPSTTTEGEKGLKAFDVWAYMDNGTGLFLGQTTTGQDNIDGEDVTGSKGNFTYVNTAYWNAGHTYYFHALAPMDSENAKVTAPTAGDALGLSNVEFTNVAGTEDLLYSTYTRTIEKGADLKDAANSGTVNLTFSHLLSKVKFSFKNTYTNPNIHFEVKDIKMTAPQTSNINLNYEDWKKNSTWTPGTGNVTLAFGTTGDIVVGDTQESADERLTIPATETQEYTITFNVLLYNGGVMVNEKDENEEAIPYQHKITLKGFAFEIGKAYDLYAELNADNIIDPDDDPYYDDENSYPIEFDVLKVEEWDYSASDAKGEDYIVEKGEEFMLVSDITVVGSLKVNSGILNGAGNTVYAEAVPTSNGLVSPTGEATIKDVTIDGKNTSTADGKAIRGIYITKAGTYTIENVKVENVAYAINVNTKAAVTLNVTKSTLEGWTSYGSSTTATFTNVNFTVGDFYGEDNQNYSNNDNGLFRPYGETKLSGCTFAEGFSIDLGSLESGKKVTFSKCKYNGTDITAENIATLVEGYAEGKVAFE